MSLLVLLSVSILYPQTIALRDTTNQFDYIIITIPELVSACEPFRQHKELVRNFRTLVVDTSQIFAEFDSSSTPEENIRAFISYTGKFWKTPYPEYILLAGTADMIPAFFINYYNLFYWYSDYYYNQSIYSTDTTVIDFMTGRIPIKDAAELQNYFNKIIEYETDNSVYRWMNTGLHLEYWINFNENYQASCLPDYMNNFIFTNYPDSQNYGNKDSIFNFINGKGAASLSLNSIYNTDSFFISWEYLNIEDMDRFTNQGKYFIVDKQRTKMVFNNNSNLSREMLVLPSAGAIGALVFTGYYAYGLATTLSCLWESYIFSESGYSLGEAYGLLWGISSFYYHMLQATNIWADPSLKLKFDTTTGVDENQVTISITNYSLSQNYPNPFNPSTGISYSVPDYSNVIIKIFDILGNEIETLVNEEKPAGKYEVLWNAGDISSGIYFYQLRAGAFVQTRKMILVK